MTSALRQGSSGVAYHATDDAAATAVGSPPLNVATEFLAPTPLLVRSAEEIRAADEAVLHEMGYKQELHRGQRKRSACSTARSWPASMHSVTHRLPASSVGLA